MIESIEDLIFFLKHFHRNLLADPSLPAEMIPDDLPEGLAKIYRELGGLVDLEYPHPFIEED
jgi:DNA-binding transcriptional regulator PaaX